MTTQMNCQYCNGTGKLSEPVMWSDGWGMATRSCPACRGTGDLVSMSDVLKRLVEAEKSSADLGQELAQTQTHVALYLAQQSGELSKLSPAHRPCDGPETDLALAPNPARWGWDEYVKRIADKAPRRNA